LSQERRMTISPKSARTSLAERHGAGNLAGRPAGADGR
jgi:hypothetical protein